MKRLNLILLSIVLLASGFNFPLAEAQYLDDNPRIPILEYHNFGEVDSRWTRSFEKFYDDLLWLYNNDFRAISVEQFINMDFSGLKDGMKPVVFTFDDSSQGQLDFTTDEVVDPRSAIGVMDEFLLEYPDFGSAATFFILPMSFGEPEFETAKLKYLIDTGRELGSHTYGHEDMDTLTAEGIQETLAKAEINVQETLGQDYKFKSLAYPNGLYPDTEELMQYIAKGKFEDHEYEIDAAFLVGARPSVLSNNKDFNAYTIPRIQAIDDEWLRWFDREADETEKSEKDFKFKAYTVGEKEKFPYENCTEFDFTPTPLGKVFWQWVENKKDFIKPNVVPETLKYKDGNYHYLITGEEEADISEIFFEYSRHYRTSDFKTAILEANPDKDFVKDDEIIIPDIPAFLIKRYLNPKEPWGIYFTAYTSVMDHGQTLVEQLKEHGGSMIVFDVKEIDGQVYYPSKVQMVADTGADQHVIIPNLENFVRYWHEKEIYLAARIVIFKDINLTKARPDLAIQSQYGGPWANREGVVWLDPSNEETQNYILDLTEEVAKAGVDEVQFDYIRFPTLGSVSSTKYNFDEENMEKHEVIRNFIAKVHDRLRPYDTKLSLDVYGVITWNDGYDSISTGQKMECLGPYIDVVYPMVYPSHFGPGFGGFAQPGDHPYYFVSESIKLFQHYLKGTNTEIRPWLQAFAWRVSNYGQWYIDEQVKAGADNDVHGYTLWNAGNNYF